MKGVFHVCKRVAAGKSMIKSLRAFKVKTGLFLIKHSLCFPLHKEGEFTSVHTHKHSLYSHTKHLLTDTQLCTLPHYSTYIYPFFLTPTQTHIHTQVSTVGCVNATFGWNVCNPCLDVWVEWGSHHVFSSRLQCWPEGAQLWTLHAGSQHGVCENREQYVCACVCGWLCTEVSVCVRMALLSPFTPGGLCVGGILWVYCNIRYDLQWVTHGLMSDLFNVWLVILL